MIVHLTYFEPCLVTPVGAVRSFVLLFLCVSRRRPLTVEPPDGATSRPEQRRPAQYPPRPGKTETAAPRQPGWRTWAGTRRHTPSATRTTARRAPSGHVSSRDFISGLGSASDKFNTLSRHLASKDVGGVQPFAPRFLDPAAVGPGAGVLVGCAPRVRQHVGAAHEQRESRAAFEQRSERGIAELRRHIPVTSIHTLIDKTGSHMVLHRAL